jgi:hypothetical protein
MRHPAASTDEALRAVVRVGGDRGFVVEVNGYLGLERYAVTAPHCLPELPPALISLGLPSTTPGVPAGYPQNSLGHARVNGLAKYLRIFKSLAAHE